MRKKKKIIRQGRINKQAKCPKCHTALDGFTSIEGRTPKKGDLSVCAYCSTILQFTEHLRLEHVSPDRLGSEDISALLELGEIVEDVRSDRLIFKS